MTPQEYFERARELIDTIASTETPLDDLRQIICFLIQAGYNPINDWPTQQIGLKAGFILDVLKKRGLSREEMDEAADLLDFERGDVHQIMADGGYVELMLLQI